MTPDLFLRTALGPALGLLPPVMDTPEARALILSIGLQESKLTHRRQFGGPARSYLQFELTGIEGVLTHRATATIARAVCVALDIGTTAPSIYIAMEYQDVLACAFARLLLWTLPRPLPRRGAIAEAWQQYLEAWRPGRPRPATWDANLLDAWHAVQPRGAAASTTGTGVICRD